MIQAFEYTYELAWEVLKDFLESRGTRELYGSRDVIRSAFQSELLDDGDVWMAMTEHRNATSHAYEESLAKEIVNVVQREYIAEFDALEQCLQQLKEAQS